MYQFKIIKVQEGGFKFELEGIKLLVDDYNIINGKYHLKTPSKAIAFFNIGNDVYSISNEPRTYDTAEALYDAIVNQYNLFNDTNSSNRNIKQSA